MRLINIASLTGMQPALSLFQVKKIHMAGKIVKMVKELSLCNQSNGEKEKGHFCTDMGG